jgi:oligoribonuclease (3'-5' exoribonuclease)
VYSEKNAKKKLKNAEHQTFRFLRVFVPKRTKKIVGWLAPPNENAIRK